MMALASSSFSTRMWRARYSVPLAWALNLSYSAWTSASVTGRLLVDVGGEQADQDALAGDLHLLLVVVRRAQAAPLGFLDQDLVGDDLVADELVDVRRQLLAARGGLLLHLGDHRVGTRLRHRLAVDDGDVLRLRGERGEADARDGRQGDAGGEETLLHDEREPFGL